MKGGNELKLLISIICTCFIFAETLPAQSLITITVTTISHGSDITIPNDFSGLSFGTTSLRKGSTYFFDSTNTQVVTLFRELGIKNLRIGGTSVDTNNSGYMPSRADIDALFRFAKATGVKVIYSLRLMNGNATQDGLTAKYIWDNYNQNLDHFAIGNEPDTYGKDDPQITGYSTYITKWKSFAAIVSDSVPEAKFGGPDGGSGTSGASWGTRFANDVKNLGTVNTIYFHDYVGASSVNKTPQQLIDEMLSTNWITSRCPTEYNASGAIVMPIGFSYRFTEANSYYTGGGAGVAGGNNCCATALFSLDYMYWWSEHKVSGVNFHTAMWKYNGTFFVDTYGNYQIYPIGYGIKAFDLGGHGIVRPVTIGNPNGLNLTAYAVDDTTCYYVTIINKEHDSGARSAIVKIVLPGLSGSAKVMYMTAPNGNLAAISGMTLGGSSINNTGNWQGVWSTIDSINTSTGSYMVTVPAGSAAIVRINSRVISIKESSKLSESFSLSQNYPNPFNPTTNINYTVPTSGFVSLKIYNILGQEVTTLFEGFQKVGLYKVDFDASKLVSGIYLYRLQTNGFTQTKKMILMK
jgi:hypothetical protein